MSTEHKRWSSKVKWFLVIAMVALLLPTSAIAKPGHVARWDLWKGKAKVWFSGQYLIRSEFFQGKDFRNYDKTTNIGVPKDQLYIGHRARLAAGALLFNRVKLFLQVQDVRLWGTETNTLGDYSADNFDLHQGWAEIKIVDALKLKAGRMEMIYDNHRLIGNVGWTLQARSFDGFQLKYEPKAFQLHAFYAMLKGGKIDIDGGNHMTGLWFRLRKFKAFRPSLLFVLDANGATKQVRGTAGTFIQGALSGFKYTAEFYAQFGSVGEGVAKQDIFAWMAAISAAYTINMATKPTFKLWGEFLSGDSDATDKKIGTFNTLFATNHKFYGFMDFFLNLPAHTKNGGLMDVGGSFKLSPAKKMALILFAHYFQLMSPRKTIGGKDLDSSLGLEFDLIAKYVVFKGHLSLLAGFSTFVPFKGAQESLGKGDQPEFWGFLQMNARF